MPPKLISNACSACQTRHRRCDGVKPVCTPCQLKGWSDRCQFVPGNKRGPKKQTDSELSFDGAAAATGGAVVDFGHNGARHHGGGIEKRRPLGSSLPLPVATAAVATAHRGHVQTSVVAAAAAADAPSPPSSPLVSTHHLVSQIRQLQDQILLMQQTLLKAPPGVVDGTQQLASTAQPALLLRPSVEFASPSPLSVQPYSLLDQNSNLLQQAHDSDSQDLVEPASQHLRATVAVAPIMHELERSFARMYFSDIADVYYNCVALGTPLMPRHVMQLIIEQSCDDIQEDDGNDDNPLHPLVPHRGRFSREAVALLRAIHLLCLQRIGRKEAALKQLKALDVAISSMFGRLHQSRDLAAALIITAYYLFGEGEIAMARAYLKHASSHLQHSPIDTSTALTCPRTASDNPAAPAAASSSPPVVEQSKFSKIYHCVAMVVAENVFEQVDKMRDNFAWYAASAEAAAAHASDTTHHWVSPHLVALTLQNPVHPKQAATTAAGPAMDLDSVKRVLDSSPFPLSSHLTASDGHSLAPSSLSTSSSTSSSSSSTFSSSAAALSSSLATSGAPLAPALEVTDAAISVTHSLEVIIDGLFGMRLAPSDATSDKHRHVDSAQSKNAQSLPTSSTGSLPASDEDEAEQRTILNTTYHMLLNGMKLHLLYLRCGHNPSQFHVHDAAANNYPQGTTISPYSSPIGDGHEPLDTVIGTASSPASSFQSLHASEYGRGAVYPEHHQPHQQRNLPNNHSSNLPFFLLPTTARPSYPELDARLLSYAVRCADAIVQCTQAKCFAKCPAPVHESVALAARVYLQSIDTFWTGDESDSIPSSWISGLEDCQHALQLLSARYSLIQLHHRRLLDLVAVRLQSFGQARGARPGVSTTPASSNMAAPTTALSISEDVADVVTTALTNDLAADEGVTPDWLGRVANRVDPAALLHQLSEDSNAAALASTSFLEVDDVLELFMSDVAGAHPNLGLGFANNWQFHDANQELLSHNTPDDVASVLSADAVRHLLLSPATSLPTSL
ncbi:hypothetical protein CAOG_00744 [Capsaspora owczarzaki ATCC 30864]|uniref:Zn(2)-C6 fungal-type domain-containing protein n=1 Tax=Capsaspora owczarzaki (strain ATCC 30864) TaxID=595528 RepID=A0A0D2U1Y9_CAPO3|nr:hypothetical protein CAOG_00744 [Capsaspora owczarzaki ATCC 30864]KJE89231.1 hypothetical protein CAOG_000744 [Capsaspora owczarzaki ATCC 30864]|eukprot:XP_004365615.1 hypothetical protein CAOG_00744 [Capsaspora owczarzaki ATCC 30864]